MPKGDRRAAKLGPGEFENPNAPNIVARYGFLNLVHRLAPEAVAALESDQDAVRWASRFGLQHVPWFVEVATQTLNMWLDDPGMRRHHVWATIGMGGRLVHELPDIRAWQYEDESEAAFDARVNEHKATVRAAAAARGLRPTRELRNPLHIQWLVRRVIQQWKVGDIAGGLEVSTVQKAINEAADLVGIPRPATLKPK